MTLNIFTTVDWWWCTAYLASTLSPTVQHERLSVVVRLVVDCTRPAFYCCNRNHYLNWRGFKILRILFSFNRQEKKPVQKSTGYSVTDVLAWSTNSLWIWKLKRLLYISTFFKHHKLELKFFLNLFSKNLYLSFRTQQIY